MIELFYNKTATNIRKTIGTPTSSDAVATVSTFLGVLRPVTDKSKLYVENNLGSEFDFVCDDSTDVKVNDDIYIDGAQYDILGVTEFEDLEDGLDSYKNLRLAK